MQTETNMREIMERLFSVKQAAEVLAVKVPTLRLWITQNRVPVLRIGRAVRVKESVLESIVSGGLEAVAGIESNKPAFKNKNSGEAWRGGRPRKG